MNLNQKGLWAAALCACVSASTHAAHQPQPVILTLDGFNYVTYNEFRIDSAAHLVLAFDALMENCRRNGGGAPSTGPMSLLYSTQNSGVQLASIRIDFAPTRAVMTTTAGDVICDGEANGAQTGLGRILRGDFESD